MSNEYFNKFDEDESSIVEPILGRQSHEEFNKKSCLKGYPLRTFKSYIEDYIDKSFDGNKTLDFNLKGISQVAHNIYKSELGSYFETAAKEVEENHSRDSKDKDIEDYEEFCDPSKWQDSLSSEDLIRRALILSEVLEEVVKEASSNQ